MIENLGPSNILSRILNILSVVFPLLIVIVLIVMGRNNRD
jgi:preprotein translocase subunit SecG